MKNGEEFGAAVAALLARMAEALDAAEAAGDDRPAQRSFVEWAPVLLLVDPARVDDELSALPPGLLERVTAHPLHRVLRIVPEDVAESPILSRWQNAQFRDLGYAVIVLFHHRLYALQRGRRVLDEAEQRLRQALALWSWALWPALEKLVERFAGQGGDWRSAYALIEANAPGLRDMAAEAAGDAPAGGDAEEHLALRELLPKLWDEGRRQVINLPDEKGQHRALAGQPLQDAFRRKAEAALRQSRPAAGRSLAESHVETLDLLARGWLAARATFAERPQAMARQGEGLDRLKGQGAVAVALDRTQGKRPRAAAQMALTASSPEAYVPQPGPNAFTPGDLAALAFLADIDPFTFTANHALFHPEIRAARSLGQRILARKAGDEPIPPVINLLKWNPQQNPPVGEIQNNLINIRQNIITVVEGCREKS